MREEIRDKKALLALLARTPHGNLKVYCADGIKAAHNDPDFFHHVVAYNHLKGSVRDAKVGLPIVALKALYEVNDGIGPTAHEVFLENALAHLADLRPREFLRAIEFGWDIGAPIRMLKRLTIRYLRDLEADEQDWTRTTLFHRNTLRRLYALMHVPVQVEGGEAVVFGKTRRGAPRLFKGNSVFEVVRTLQTLSPIEIAGMIARHRLPFLIARDAAGAKAKEPDVVLALMNRMSPTELVSNMKWLKRCGVATVPALRSGLEAALGAAGTAKAMQRTKRGAVLKATKAAEVLGDDEVLSGKLRVLQEKQIQVALPSIEGNWLVLADKSGSMEHAMEIAKVVASTIARAVTGNVYLVFFDESPRFYDVTGKSLEDIKTITQTLTAAGGTSIGCGVDYLRQRGLAVDGIAIVSDGCENTGIGFAWAYGEYAKAFDVAPMVYLYRVEPHFPPDVLEKYGRSLVESEARRQLAAFREHATLGKIEIEEFVLTDETDYYAVPNLVAQMKVRRWELLDQILAVPFRRLDEVLTRTSLPVVPQPNRVMV